MGGPTASVFKGAKAAGRKDPYIPCLSRQRNASTATSCQKRQSEDTQPEQAKRRGLGGDRRNQLNGINSIPCAVVAEGAAGVFAPGDGDVTAGVG